VRSPVFAPRGSDHINVDPRAGVMHQRAGSRRGFVIGMRKHRKQTTSRGRAHASRPSVGSPTSGWFPGPGPLWGISFPQGPRRVGTVLRLQRSSYAWRIAPAHFSPCSSPRQRSPVCRRSPQRLVGGRQRWACPADGHPYRRCSCSRVGRCACHEASRATAAAPLAVKVPRRHRPGHPWLRAPVSRTPGA
jgi:hypothetical protein